MDGFRFHVRLSKPGKNIIKTNSLDQRQEKILQMFDTNVNGLRTIEILQFMGEDIPLRTLRRYLTQFKNLGIVETRGRGSNAIWFKL